MAGRSRAGVTSITTPSDVEIAIRRAFDAPRQLVWDAWTSPEHMPHWMLGPEGWTMPVCEIDLRPGGRHRSVWRREDGSEMEIRGAYREVDPPARLVYSESWGAEWPETVDTLVLEEEDGSTVLTLTIRYPTKEARDAALDTGMMEGMERSFIRLGRYLATIG